MKKINFKKSILILIAVVIVGTSSLFAQKRENGYTFTIVKEVKATPVKDQYRSGTCWSFAAISFLETELLRIGKGEYDLSEMFIVRNSYVDKAEKFIRYHGKASFGGGQAHDVTNVIRKYGLVPEEAYTGLNIGEESHVHSEMDAVLQGMLEAIEKNEGRKLTIRWKEAFEAVLDVYLGKVPETFVYKNKTYTPKSFAAETGLNMDEYIEITSYTNYPFYEKVDLEVPDNWSHDDYYNVPLDEFMAIIDNSFEKGYSVCWDGDVSEKGFSWSRGIASIPDEKIVENEGTEKSRWVELSTSEKNDLFFDFVGTVKEKTITQGSRQETFDNYKTTDDHLMHLTGIAKDKNGVKYYLTKNSWNVDGNPYGGYIYMSESYVKLKTIAIMVHKDAVPKDIAKKLKL